MTISDDVHTRADEHKQWTNTYVTVTDAIVLRIY